MLFIKTCIYILSETRQNIILSNETFVECGGAGLQKKIVFVERDKTSSALIIMGIFFIVVVIGLFYYLPQWSPGKVIIHRSRGGVSSRARQNWMFLVWAYLKCIIEFLRKKKYFFTFILCNFLVRTLQWFLKYFKFCFCPWKLKKTTLKSCS